MKKLFFLALFIGLMPNLHGQDMPPDDDYTCSSVNLRLPVNGITIKGCDTTHVTIRVVNSSTTSTATGIRINLGLKAGFSLVSFQASGIAIQSGAGFNVPFLNPNDSMTISYVVKASCAALTPNIRPLIDTVSYSFTQDGTTLSCSGSSFTYNYQAPYLNYNQSDNIKTQFSGTVNTTFTRMIKLVNTGNGVFNGTVHIIRLQPDPMNLKIMGALTVSGTASVTSMTVTQTGDIFAHIKNLAPGDSIKYSEDVKILGCLDSLGGFSNIQISWGCDSTCSYLPSYQIQPVVQLIDNPFISAVLDSSQAPTNPYCQGIGARNKFYFTLRNTGNGPATNVALNLLPIYSTGSAVDASDIQIIVNGQSHEISRTVTSASGVGLLPNPIASASILLDTLRTTDVVQFIYTQTKLCAGQGYYDSWGFSARYNNICGKQTTLGIPYNPGSLGYNESKFGFEQLSIDIPGALDSGSVGKFEYPVKNYELYNALSKSSGFLINPSTGIMKVVVTTEMGLRFFSKALTNNYFINRYQNTKWLPYKIVESPNTAGFGGYVTELYFHFSDLPGGLNYTGGGFSFLQLASFVDSLKATCPANMPVKVTQQAFIITDSTCLTACAISSKMVESSTFVNCPNCKVFGSNGKSKESSLIRTSIGLADLDFNGLPDVPFTKATGPFIRTKRAMVGDTIRYTYLGDMSDGEPMPNGSTLPGITFNEFETQVKLSPLKNIYLEFKTPYRSNMVPVGTVNFAVNNSNGTTVAALLANSVVTDNGEAFWVDLNVDLINANKISGPDYVMSPNDAHRVSLDLFIKSNMSIPGLFDNAGKTNTLLLVTNKAGAKKTDFMDGSMKARMNLKQDSSYFFYCKGDPQVFTFVSYHDTLFQSAYQSVSNDPCRKAVVLNPKYTLGTLIQGELPFPGEYRPAAYTQQMKFNLPVGYRFDSVVFQSHHVQYSPTSGSQSPLYLNQRIPTTTFSGVGGAVGYNFFPEYVPLQTTYPTSIPYLNGISDNIGNQRWSVGTTNPIVSNQNNIDAYYVYLSRQCDLAAIATPVIPVDTSSYFTQAQGSPTPPLPLIDKAHDTLKFFKPNIFIPDQFTTVSTKDVCWPLNVQLGQNPPGFVPQPSFAFLAIATTPSRIHITKVIDPNGKTIALNTLSGLYQLGQIQASPPPYQLCGTYTCQPGINLASESIAINYGWECSQYPVNINSVSCSDASNTKTAVFRLQEATRGLTLGQIQGPDSVNACGSQYYSVKVLSSGGSVYNITATASSLGAGMVLDSIRLGWNGTYVNVAPSSIGSASSDALDSLRIHGLANGDTLNFRFKFNSSCSYDLNNIQVNIAGLSYCGDIVPVSNSPQVTKPVFWKGLKLSTFSNLNLNVGSGQLNCPTTVGLTITVSGIRNSPTTLNNGAVTSRDSVYVRLPMGLAPVTGAGWYFVASSNTAMRAITTTAFSFPLTIRTSIQMSNFCGDNIPITAYLGTRVTLPCGTLTGCAKGPFRADSVSGTVNVLKCDIPVPSLVGIPGNIVCDGTNGYLMKISNNASFPVGTTYTYTTSGLVSIVSGTPTATVSSNISWGLPTVTAVSVRYNPVYNGCRGREWSTSININPLPTPTVSTSGTYCPLTTVTYMNLSATTVSGSNNTLTNQYWAFQNGKPASVSAFGAASIVASKPGVTYTIPGIFGYTLTVTNTFSCRQTASGNTTIYGIPQVTVSPADACQAGRVSICTGQGITATVQNAPSYFHNPPFTYSWSSISGVVFSTTSGSFLDQNSFLPTTSGTYKISVTDSRLCGTGMATASVVLSVPPKLVSSTPLKDTVICTGTSLQINGLRVTQCTGYAQVQLINPLGQAVQTFTNGSTSACTCPVGGYTLPGISIQPMAVPNTLWKLRVTDKFGCSRDTSFNIQYEPQVNVVQVGGTACSNPTVTLQAFQTPSVAGGNYSWTLDGTTILTGTSANFTGSQAADTKAFYAVQWVSNRGCLSIATANISNYQLTPPSLVGPTSICGNNSTTYVIGNASNYPTGTQFDWSVNSFAGNSNIALTTSSTSAFAQMGNKPGVDTLVVTAYYSPSCPAAPLRLPVTTHQLPLTQNNFATSFYIDYLAGMGLQILDSGYLCPGQPVTLEARRVSGTPLTNRVGIPSLGGSISYSWDLTGANIIPTSITVPSIRVVEYPTGGRYPIIFSGTTGRGCSQQVKDTIVVKPELPLPIISGVSSICGFSNTTYTLSNATAFPSNTVFNWSIQSYANNPNVTLTSGGSNALAYFGGKPGIDTLLVQVSASGWCSPQAAKKTVTTFQLPLFQFNYGGGISIFGQSDFSGIQCMDDTLGFHRYRGGFPLYNRIEVPEILSLLEAWSTPGATIINSNVDDIALYYTAGGKYPVIYSGITDAGCYQQWNDSINVQNKFVEPIISGPSSICGFSNATYTLANATAFPSNAIFNWSVQSYANNPNITLTTAGINSPAYFGGQPGVDTLGIIVTAPGWCSSPLVKKVTTTFPLPLHQANYNADIQILMNSFSSTYCLDEEIILVRNLVMGSLDNRMGIPSSDFTYTWSVPGANIASLSIPLIKISYPSRGTYPVSYVGTSDFGCLQQINHTITVNDSLPEPIVTGPPIVCPILTAVYTVTNLSAYPSGSFFSWSVGAFNPSNPNLTLTYNQYGSIQVNFGNTGVVDTLILEVTGTRMCNIPSKWKMPLSSLLPSPTVSGSSIVCPLSNPMYTVTNSSDYPPSTVFTWSVGAANPSTPNLTLTTAQFSTQVHVGNISATDTLKLQIGSLAGCTAPPIWKLPITPEPKVTVSPTSVPSCGNATINLQATVTLPSVVNTYTWFKNGIQVQSGTSDSYTDNPTINTDNNYRVQLLSNRGCLSTATVSVPNYDACGIKEVTQCANLVVAGLNNLLDPLSNNLTLQLRPECSINNNGAAVDIITHTGGIRDQDGTYNASKFNFLWFNQTDVDAANFYHVPYPPNTLPVTVQSNHLYYLVLFEKRNASDTYQNPGPAIPIADITQIYDLRLDYTSCIWGSNYSPVDLLVTVDRITNPSTDAFIKAVNYDPYGYIQWKYDKCVPSGARIEAPERKQLASRKQTEQLIIYPNPFSRNTQLFGNPDTEYYIYNLEGKVVETGTLDQNGMATIGESLRNGFYIVKSGGRTGKFLKIE